MAVVLLPALVLAQQGGAQHESDPALDQEQVNIVLFYFFFFIKTKQIETKIEMNETNHLAVAFLSGIAGRPL